MTRIMVIEDDTNLRKNICDLLQCEGYKIDCAENGEMGLKKIQSVRPDLIICDIMMPALNGYDVLKYLQNDIHTADIPFIFLTAKVERENVRMGMKLGADDYLSKPFNIVDLLDTVEARLRKNEIKSLQTEKIREQIVNKIPHELRTPLVPILGLSEMIEEEEDLVAIKDMVKSINKSGKVLHGRIEKLLIYKDLCTSKHSPRLEDAAIDSSEISFHTIQESLDSLPGDLAAIDRTEIKIEQARIGIKDWELNIIIRELAENSLKFSDAGEKILIEGSKSGGMYVLAFSDKGRGMAEDEIRSLTAFNKFGENQFSESGMGLGLAIVKKIIDSYGGMLEITSRRNEFTRLALTMNLAVMPRENYSDCIQTEN